MERLEANRSVRFTPAQRDALLDLASRLQAEHRATLEAEDIARAAAEAGIEPRFVQEALLQIDSPTEKGADLRMPLAAMIGLALVNLIFLFNHQRWADSVTLSPLRLLLMVGAAFVLAIPVVRQRSLRWIAPLGVIATWIPLTIGFAVLMRLQGQFGWGWLPKAALLIGFLQTLAAVAAATIDWIADRSAHWFRSSL